MTLKMASMGSVSHGTLRSQDLVESFYNELEWQLQRQDRTPENREEIDKLHNVLGDECWDADGNVVDDEELLSQWINETLIDALNQFSPAYVSVLAVDSFDAAVRAERITGVWMIAECAMRNVV